MKLAIGGPTRDHVPAPFFVAYARLYAYTRERGPWTAVDDLFMEHTYIHCGRELVLEAAIKQGCTHLLWLDTDMQIPRTAAVQLFAHGQPIVAANYRARRPGANLFTAHGFDGQRVETSEASTGLEAVDYCGMGCCLMQTDVVKGLGRPWFRHGLNDFGGDVGEDAMLFRGLASAGFTTYIDHDLSKQVGHVGQTIYRTVDAAAVVTA